MPEVTERFSDRVSHYVRSRPGYPPAVITLLAREIGLAPGWHVADLGAGTGISSQLFLDAGCRVSAVEPNREMRAAAAELLGDRPGFAAVEGTAETTTLAAASCDAVVAGQAFHWFEPLATRRECRRILKPGGWVVLLWNRRHTDTTPFLRAYEELLLRYGTDYREVDHRRIDPPALDAFFGPGARRGAELPNHQSFAREGLAERLLSSSYTPPPGHPNHLPMLAALGELFDRWQVEGRVRFDYTTEVHWGRLALA